MWNTNIKAINITKLVQKIFNTWFRYFEYVGYLPHGITWWLSFNVCRIHGEISFLSLPFCCSILPKCLLLIIQWAWGFNNLYCTSGNVYINIHSNFIIFLLSLICCSFSERLSSTSLSMQAHSFHSWVRWHLLSRTL